jgi:Rnl2 family RNA ligase
MRFRTFPKIPAQADPAARSPAGPWVALEKLHGAQLVVGVAGSEVRFGKRKEWMEPGAAFFGWQLLAAGLAESLTELARKVGAAQLVAYGELFGGGYPHPEVPAVSGLQPVQTGIWYSPDLHWAVFDVLVATGEEDAGELLAHAEVEVLAREVRLLTPPVLARGRKGELMTLPVRFPTRLPALLGLPALENNVAEGLVLKPDARFRAGERSVLKRKIPEFDDARFDESQPWRPARLSREELGAWVERLVNPARIASARSKVGADPAAILEEVVLDVSVDLEQVFRDAWDAAGPEGQAWLQERARAKALKLVER